MTEQLEEQYTIPELAELMFVLTTIFLAGMAMVITILGMMGHSIGGVSVVPLTPTVGEPVYAFDPYAAGLAGLAGSLLGWVLALGESDDGREESPRGVE